MQQRAYVHEIAVSVFLAAQQHLDYKTHSVLCIPLFIRIRVDELPKRFIVQRVFHSAPLVRDFKFICESTEAAFVPVQQEGFYAFRVVRDGRGGFHDFEQDVQSRFFSYARFLVRKIPVSCRFYPKCP